MQFQTSQRRHKKFPAGRGDFSLLAHYKKTYPSYLVNLIKYEMKSLSSDEVELRAFNAHFLQLILENPV